MQLVLAPAFDSGIGIKPPHALGIRHVGPYGFVGLLEAELALPAPEASHTKSVMAYLQFLQSDSHQGRFFWQSLNQASAIRTAETLLHWRNTLYEHSWDGTWSGDEVRLSDMAAVEASGANRLMLGLGLRCRRIIERLDIFSSQVTHIEIINRESLAPMVEALLVKLEECGVKLTTHHSVMSFADTDLGQVQKSLTNKGVSTTTKATTIDDSISWFQAQSLQMAVRWVTEHVRTNPSKRIAIFAPDNAQALEDALKVSGLPMAGITNSSSARPVLQLLPLTLQLLIDPLDPQALLQFLTHPVGPLPYRLCRDLAKVVANKPGIGSAAWQQVVEDYFTRLAESEPGRVMKQRQQLAKWFEIERHPRHAIPVVAINAQLQLLRRWLRGRESTLEDYSERQLYQQAIGQVDELDLAIATFQANTQAEKAAVITSDDLDDIMHQVRSRGSHMNGISAQAGHVCVLTDAGSFVPELESGIFDTIIWLGVEEQSAEIWPWFLKEQSALSAQGVVLTDHALLAERATEQAQRVVLAAREKLVLVQLLGDKASHPLLEKTRNLLGEHFSPQPLAALITEPASSMVAVTPVSLPSRERWWSLDGNVMTSSSVRWSYSRISQLLSSPNEYVLNYLAKIRNDDLLTLSDGALLKGSLVHLLIEDFFNEHVDNWREQEDKELDQWARTKMDVLIREQGAVLIQPGRHVEAEQLKDTAAIALKRLLEHMNTGSVAKVEVEKRQESAFGSEDFLGFIDLLVTHTDGTETVIDMKWGGLNARRDEIRDNLAIQLATYGWLRRQNDAELWPDHGFFIIVSSQLLMTNKNHFPLATEVQTTDEGSLAELWKKVELTLAWRKEQLKSGQVELPVPGIAQDRTVEPAKGGLDIKDSLAPWSDYTHLSGWE